MKVIQQQLHKDIVPIHDARAQWSTVSIIQKYIVIKLH